MRSSHFGTNAAFIDFPMLVVRSKSYAIVLQFLGEARSGLMQTDNMPKRKRMSFTVKRRRASSTPVKQSQPTPPTKRARGRPPKGAVPAAAAVAAAAPRKRQKKGRDSGKQREDTEPEEEPEEDLEIEDEGEEEEDEAESEQSELEDQDDVEEGQDQDDELEEEEEEDDDDEEEEGEGDDDDGDEEEEEERTRARASSATARAKQSGRKTNPQVSESGQTIAYVPKSTIEKKWTRLDSESQSAVRGVLAAAARPAIASHLDAAAVAGEENGRGAEAQAAVRRAVRSVERRLSKMPFPPRTEAAMFEYEGLLKDNSMLKRRVRAQADDFALLQRELARVREGTESADAEAASLEKEYETERRARERRVGGKLGYLLAVPDVEPVDSARKIRLAPRPNGGGGGGGELKGDGESESEERRGVFSRAAVEEDKARLTDEARELLKQLQDHLDGSPKAAADWALARDIDRAEEVIDRLLVARRRPVHVDKLVS